MTLNPLNPPKLPLKSPLLLLTPLKIRSYAQILCLFHDQEQNHQIISTKKVQFFFNTLFITSFAVILDSDAPGHKAKAPLLETDDNETLYTSEPWPQGYATTRPVYEVTAVNCEANITDTLPETSQPL